MQEKTGFEIERKYLIAMPNMEILKKESTRCLEIEQTYLLSSPKESARVRKITENGLVSYIYTHKTKISAMKRLETEREIPETEYNALLLKADPTRRVIQKMRYCLPHAGHTFEIDIFPFWTDKAFLEIELSHESETFMLPPHMQVLREVTEDRRYTNAALAKELPE